MRDEHDLRTRYPDLLGGGEDEGLLGLIGAADAALRRPAPALVVEATRGALRMRAEARVRTSHGYGRSAHGQAVGASCDAGRGTGVSGGRGSGTGGGRLAIAGLGGLSVAAVILAALVLNLRGPASPTPTGAAFPTRTLVRHGSSRSTALRGTVAVRPASAGPTAPAATPIQGRLAVTREEAIKQAVAAARAAGEPNPVVLEASLGTYRELLGIANPLPEDLPRHYSGSADPDDPAWLVRLLGTFRPEDLSLPNAECRYGQTEMRWLIAAETGVPLGEGIDGCPVEGAEEREVVAALENLGVTLEEPIDSPEVQQDAASDVASSIEGVREVRDQLASALWRASGRGLVRSPVWVATYEALLDPSQAGGERLGRAYAVVRADTGGLELSHLADVEPVIRERAVLDAPLAIPRARFEELGMRWDRNYDPVVKGLGALLAEHGGEQLFWNRWSRHSRQPTSGSVRGVSDQRFRFRTEDGARAFADAVIPAYASANEPYHWPRPERLDAAPVVGDGAVAYVSTWQDPPVRVVYKVAVRNGAIVSVVWVFGTRELTAEEAFAWARAASGRVEEVEGR